MNGEILYRETPYLRMFPAAPEVFVNRVEEHAEFLLPVATRLPKQLSDGWDGQIHLVLPIEPCGVMANSERNRPPTTIIYAGEIGSGIEWWARNANSRATFSISIGPTSPPIAHCRNGTNKKRTSSNLTIWRHDNNSSDTQSSSRSMVGCVNRQRSGPGRKKMMNPCVPR